MIFLHFCYYYLKILYKFVMMTIKTMNISNNSEKPTFHLNYLERCTKLLLSYVSY